MAMFKVLKISLPGGIRTYDLPRPVLKTKLCIRTSKVRPELGRLFNETFFTHYSNELA
jgi:hypothetical protein